MAHFRAVIQGGRGMASRLGHKSSGIWAKVQTWGYDVLVDVSHDNGTDYAVVRTMQHGDWNSSLVARINLTTGEVLK